MAKKWTLIDGNNWLRRKYEEDRSTSGLRASVIALRSELANANRQTVFFWDGFNGNQYRKEIYPAYKGKRSPLGQDAFYLQIDLFREIVKHLPIPYFRVDNWEADDLIAGFFHALPPETYVHIKSTDKDFEQLGGFVGHEGKTIQSDLEAKIEKMKAEGKDVTGLDPIVTADRVLPYKLMVGDNSDNIAGIPGYGFKRWLAADKEQIKAWIDSDFDEAELPEMSDKLVQWTKDNRDTLFALRKVISFRPVDKEFLNANLKMGIDNPAKVEQILKENFA